MNFASPERLASSCLGALLFSSLIIPTPLYAIPPKEAALHDIGIRTIKAIAAGDSKYISTIVDPQGISVGQDDVKHSAESFRTYLADHTGLYCDLFEKGCKTDHNPAYTLEHVLSSGGDPLDADLQFKLDKDNGSLDYLERGGDDLIVILSYRFTGGKWYLYKIHFV